MSGVREIKESRLYATDKLKEALYFLLQMRRSYVDRNEFVYNLNAFINSSRNVTFVLQKEFSYNPHLKAWYLKKQEEIREDKLFKFFNEMRVASVHKEGIPKHRTSIRWAYIIPKKERAIFSYSERKVSGEKKDGEARLVVPTFDQTGMHSKPMFIEPLYSLVTFWEFDKAPEGYEGKDILGLSVEYYHKLERLINEAARRLTEDV